MAAKILILSNMGPSKLNPNSGRFVANQYHALKALSELKLDYYYLNQDKKYGINKLLRYPLFFLRFLVKYVFSTKRLDLIHVHFYFPTILLAVCYKLLRNSNVKIVVTFHGSDIYKYSKPNLLYKQAASFASHFIFVSQSLKERFFMSTKGEVLSAGAADLFYLTEHETKLDNQYDCVFVGHLDHNKGVDRLISLVKFNNQLKIAVVGNGPCEYQLQTLKNHNIELLGALEPEALKNTYQRSKCLINLSRHESFGLVMTEAMACGVPVIATETDGAQAQIESGINGFIIANDEFSPEKLDRQISDLLEMTLPEYEALSKNAIQLAQKHKLSNVTHQINQLYFKLLNIKTNE